MVGQADRIEARLAPVCEQAEPLRLSHEIAEAQPDEIAEELPVQTCTHLSAQSAER